MWKGCLTQAESSAAANPSQGSSGGSGHPLDLKASCLVGGTPRDTAAGHHPSTSSVWLLKGHITPEETHQELRCHSNPHKCSRLVWQPKGTAVFSHPHPVQPMKDVPPTPSLLVYGQSTEPTQPALLASVFPELCLQIKGGKSHVFIFNWTTSIQQLKHP